MTSCICLTTNLSPNHQKQNTAQYMWLQTFILTHPKTFFPQNWSHPKTKWKISKDIKPATSNYTLHALTHQAQTLNHTNTAQLTYNSPNHKKIISTTTLSYLYNQLAAQPNFTETKSHRKNLSASPTYLPIGHHKSTKKISNPNYKPQPPHRRKQPCNHANPCVCCNVRQL